MVKLRFEGGLVAAWKPDTRRGPGRYRGEVAARRLATALGLEANVPEAMLRGFALDELRPGLPPEAVRLLEAEAVPARDGRIPGALIPWIPGLRFPPLDRQPALGRWRGELAGAPGAHPGDATPEGRARLAELSALVVFDSVSGNWDRWSGGNLGEHPSTGRLLFIDNDGAFLATPPADALARQRRLLAGTRRFSASLALALAALDAERLDLVFGRDLSGGPLLGAEALAGVRARLGEVKRAVATQALDAGAPLP
ncbi:MAG: hypothetical protein IPF92_05395 [Myxococcales bacterium]|nr:hypothetical protein [Myxococcales bacterium]MBL0198003.1 hypothetical protein [Myxococcales bacterium]